MSLQGGKSQPRAPGGGLISFFLNSMQRFKTNEQLHKNATTDFLHTFPAAYGRNYASEKNKNAQKTQDIPKSARDKFVYTLMWANQADT